MADLDNFLELLAAGKKQKKSIELQEQKQLGDFLSAVAQAKSEDPKHQLIKQVKKRVQEDVSDLFNTLTAAQSETTPPVPEVVVEAPTPDIKPAQQVLGEVVVPEVKPAAEQTPLDQIIKHLGHNASFQQPDPDKVDPNIKAIQDKLKFMEQWLGKIAATGPGGGAGEIYNLDMPTRVVTSDYTINRKDYYIGVNADVKVTITLPTAGRNLKNGRVIVIKDESGHAQLTPIKVIGLVDNDPLGFEIRINNGAVQLIYRDGWRII